MLNGKAAQDKLVELFTGDNPPTFVVEFQSAGVCNPGGPVAALLRERYAHSATVDGLSILMLRDGAPVAVPVASHSQQ